jgi:hypothetical protein
MHKWQRGATEHSAYTHTTIDANHHERFVEREAETPAGRCARSTPRCPVAFVKGSWGVCGLLVRRNQLGVQARKSRAVEDLLVAQLLRLLASRTSD